MEEQFLHFVWQHQYFDHQELITDDKLPITISHPGHRNSNSGPDFLNAKLEIGAIEWHGHVEIHVKSSDWHAHNHSADESYQNTILHVVWSNDQAVYRIDGSEIATLSLKGRVKPSIYDRFRKLVKSPATIPCGPQLREVDSVIKTSLLERVLVERLIVKSRTILELLQINHGDWEETTYQVLGRNFGFKTNGDTFFELTKSIPFKVLLKHSKDQIQTEALLFGQAGFLEESNKDSYSQKLLSEYNFLKSKYRLEPRVSLHRWKFLRMRPANFPSIRLAQFASLLNSQSSLFSWILNSSDTKRLILDLQIAQSDYWKSHYKLGERSTSKIHSVGNSSAINIVINSIVPIFAAYSQTIDDSRIMDTAVALLINLNPENNKITRIYGDLGWLPINGADSQGFIQLYNNYCLKKRCLYCNVGAQLLKDSNGF
ncbi:MAG: DUF2851 family protein [Bacteroidetes bacterium]|nr:DUF2851 family protein [Bacteroidota bacterium]MDA1121051.1 DUF2851 family protein [Bacteroidota bacterium]